LNAIKKDKTILDYYPRLSPIKTKDFICISSGFGWRNHPIYKKPIFHEGVDISARPGTKVYASASGRVDKIMYSKFGYGNRIVIKHKYGYETLYAHLGNINVKKGQTIKIGQLIGTVGSTGLSTGYHLHYEVHLDGDYEDPLAYFYSGITNDLIADVKK
jgi:murein DD-endopeptidase MepM/ murein hydrolase activator NlpD